MSDLKSEWEYIPTVQTHLIRSKYVRQDFKIQVMQPARKRGETTRFPVVYATDGNFAFDALKGISYGIQRSGRDGPRFILVGIGYPGDSPFAGAVLRLRDLTFTGYPQSCPRPPPMEGVLVAKEGERDVCGGEDFQRFIVEELIPLIDGSYPTIPDDRTLFGHSGGGSFGLFTLFTRPDLFKRYIVSSPAMIYHGESSAGIQYENYDFLLEQARRFIKSEKPLAGVSAYMSVGAKEEFEANLAAWQLTSGFYRMAALLKAAEIPGLSLTTEAFPAESHMTVWPMAFVHGIQAVFPPNNEVEAGELDV